ncbi:MAG: class I SAM-dependent methyltransferase [Planctomycetota bacterium]|nr:class I SAM-dependent methyltransferase [Planctomycetota bacterium]
MISTRSEIPSKTTLEPGSLGPVQETMLITLWARSIESQRPDALTRDDKAVEIQRRLEYDFSRFERGWKSQIGVAVRDRYIDRLTRAFLERHPESNIINLGAGLDTRCFRIDNGLAHWFDVDLPDAIALRSKFIEQTSRRTFLETSGDDFHWMDRIRDTNNRPTLLIAEGVLMFFEERLVHELIKRQSEVFTKGEMIFDLIGPMMVQFPFLHDTLPRTRARFRWGAKSLHAPIAWKGKYEFASSRSMLEEEPARWRWMRWCRYLPILHRQFFVVHLQSPSAHDQTKNVDSWM